MPIYKPIFEKTTFSFSDVKSLYLDDMKLYFIIVWYNNFISCNKSIFA